MACFFFHPFGSPQLARWLHAVFFRKQAFASFPASAPPNGFGPSAFGKSSFASSLPRHLPQVRFDGPRIFRNGRSRASFPASASSYGSGIRLSEKDRSLPSSLGISPKSGSTALGFSETGVLAHLFLPRPPPNGFGPPAFGKDRSLPSPFGISPSQVRRPSDFQKRAFSRIFSCLGPLPTGSAPRLFENGRLRAASSGTAGRGRRAVPQSAEGCPRTAAALRRRYAPIGEPDAGIHSATDENASLPQGFGSGSAAGRPVDAAPPGSSAAGLRPGSIALPGRSGAPEPRRAHCTHRPREFRPGSERSAAFRDPAPRDSPEPLRCGDPPAEKRTQGAFGAYRRKKRGTTNRRPVFRPRKGIELTARGGSPIPYRSGLRVAGKDYFSSTSAPASSSWPLIDSASSFETPSFTAFGAPSTRALASPSDRPAISFTALITWSLA